MTTTTSMHGDRDRGRAERRRGPIAASHPAVVRHLLGALLAFGALNAFAGGYYGLSGAESVPKEWLAGSPFSSYLIPSLVLFVVVGGSLLAAAIAVFASRRSARVLALAAGAIVLVWLAVQVSIIGYVSWMQLTTAIASVVILLLASTLPSEVATRAMTIGEAASQFLSERRIAVTGVSRHPLGHGSNFVYQRLRERGYEVFAVNPTIERRRGRRSRSPPSCSPALGKQSPRIRRSTRSGIGSVGPCSSMTSM